MKNYAGYTKVYVGFQGAGRAVYVKNDMVEVVKKAMNKHQSNYHLTTIFREIVGLNADPLKGSALNSANDARIITSGNIRLKYYMFNGLVFVQLLAISKHSSTKKIALYKVTYNSEDNRWRPSREPANKLDHQNLWRSKDGAAHYVAVAGKFDHNLQAAERLISHLTGAYQKEDYLTTSDAKAPYSMLWIEKGHHKKPEAAQQLASLIQQSAQRQLAVNWLVHGEGTHTFKNMAEVLKRERASLPKVGQTITQNVYFSNPSIESEKKLQQWCDDAGLRFVGLNSNQRDLRKWSTVKNVCAEMGNAASMAVALSGTISVVDTVRALRGGGIDQTTGNSLKALAEGNYFAALACVAATGFIAYGMYKNTPAIAAGISCTFGKGNQKWYVDDEKLIRS